MDNKYKRTLGFMLIGLFGIMIIFALIENEQIITPAQAKKCLEFSLIPGITGILLFIPEILPKRKRREDPTVLY